MLNKRLQKTLFSGVLAGVMLVTSMQGSWTVGQLDSWTVGQLDRIKVSRQVSWGGYLNV